MKKRNILVATAALAASAAAGAGAFFAGRRALGRHERDEHVYSSMFGDAEVFTMETEAGVPVRVLYVGGGFQSASYLGDRRFEPVFEYYRAFDHMFEADIEIDNILMIGGGGFSYPKHLLTTVDGPRIDVVELDPAIVDIARKHFFVDELEEKYGLDGLNRLGTYVQDGLEFIKDVPDATYDVVINDSFDGANPTVGLLTSTALAEAKRIMTPKGLYLLNAVVGEGDDDILHTFMEIMLEGFDNVYAISCFDEEFAGEENWLIVGTDGSYNFTGVEAMLSK